MDHYQMLFEEVSEFFKERLSEVSNVSFLLIKKIFKKI